MYSHESKPQTKPLRCKAVLPPSMAGTWRARRYLKKRGLDYITAAWNGWYSSEAAGDRAIRIVIPCSSANTLEYGTFWQARAIEKDVEPRYQSPHSTRGDAVCVVRPLKGNGRAAVVEGPMDALAAAGEGFLGIALMGNTPPQAALDLTKELIRGRIVVLVADMDAGSAFARLLLSLLFSGTTVRLASPYPYKDLAEAPREARRRILAC